MIASPDLNERISLTRLPREIAVLTGQPGPSYYQCYKAILNGWIPAEKDGREYKVNRSDLPAIAAAFGLSIAA